MNTRQTLAVHGFAFVLLAGSTAVANGQEACSCDNLPDSICSAQGFGITLLNFAVDNDAGTSTWDYEVCNDKGLEGTCTPPKDLSHVNIDLPGIGTCLTEQQSVTLAQIGGYSAATLACGVSEKDPSCDIFGTKDSDFVGKCDVVGNNDLDPGECVTMRLTIAGEKPTLGAGAASTVTKAGPGCASDCIKGPSCEPCTVVPPEELGCLTRTPGFWGTHPHITNLFLPVTVCGMPLDNVYAGSCDSVSEALCVAPGRESKSNEAYAQLVRQLAAAKLNLAATAANDGSCSAGIEVRIAACEALCGASKKDISASGCIADLTAFNESLDTVAVTPTPFDQPGPANPAECTKANGNGIVIGKGTCL